MRRILAGLTLAFVLANFLPAQDPRLGLLEDGLPSQEAEEKPYRYQVAVPTTLPKGRALAPALLFETNEGEAGNAATLWLRAGQLARSVKRRITEDEEKWSGMLAFGAPTIDKLPKDKMEKLLEPYQQSLRVAHEAARRKHCDWGEPPLTMASLNDHLPLDEIQSMRELARLLCFEHRLALAKGDWKGAQRIIRTGLVMAHHLGESNLLIAHLVGIAIEAIIMGRIEEMMILPDAPNLYWPLTDLPERLVDIRRSVRYELNTYHRSFPALSKLEVSPTEPMTQGQILAIFKDTLRGFQPEGDTPEWQQALMMTAMVSRYYPAAKQALLGQGATAEQVEKLPTAQVVGLYFLNQYNGFRDEVLKLQNLPAWQARPFYEQLEKKIAAQMKEQANPFLMLFPAVNKVDFASVRSQRNVAILRTAEAIKLHAAHNAGALPGKLSDITVAALPLDPSTGKTFEAFYRKNDRGMSLEVPPLPPLQPHHARYFDFISPKKEKP